MKPWEKCSWSVICEVQRRAEARAEIIQKQESATNQIAVAESLSSADQALAQGFQVDAARAVRESARHRR